jgi:hypothetical protein
MAFIGYILKQQIASLHHDIENYAEPPVFRLFDPLPGLIYVPDRLNLKSGIFEKPSLRFQSAHIVVYPKNFHRWSPFQAASLV